MALLIRPPSFNKSAADARARLPANAHTRMGRESRDRHHPFEMKRKTRSPFAARPLSLSSFLPLPSLHFRDLKTLQLIFGSLCSSGRNSSSERRAEGTETRRRGFVSPERMRQQLVEGLFRPPCAPIHSVFSARFSLHLPGFIRFCCLPTTPKGDPRRRRALFPPPSLRSTKWSRVTRRK